MPKTREDYEVPEYSKSPSEARESLVFQWYRRMYSFRHVTDSNNEDYAAVFKSDS
jgi:aminoglycoside/choline kinase family phosphotransferase